MCGRRVELLHARIRHHAYARYRVPGICVPECKRSYWLLNRKFCGSQRDRHERGAYGCREGNQRDLHDLLLCVHNQLHVYGYGHRVMYSSLHDSCRGVQIGYSLFYF